MMPDESPTETKGQPGFVPAALSGLCPRCGAKTLFDGGAQLADECAQCGLDFLSLERGGRFVGVVAMLIALALIMAALGIDAWLRPPLLPSLVFWCLAAAGSVIGGLRLYKAMWVYHGYEESQS
jgi:uncharacterized protein (DUF983 family)